MEWATWVTFGLYFVLLIWIGGRFYTKAQNTEEYLLGGRGLGAWVTALSAQASDMSGWLLMGLPGAIYLAGASKSWIAVGLIAGTVLNWLFVSGRLRVYTERTNSITLPCFFADRFRDPTGLLRVVAALLILFFFAIYAGAGLVAAGKLFKTMLGVEYHVAAIVGVSIVMLYTFLGGYLAVCWTDLIQGVLMFFAIVVAPVVAYFAVGGWGAVAEAVAAKESASLSLMPATGTIGVISTMAWGLGYFGQPHILARFMSVKSVGELPRSRLIAIVWVVVSLAGAVAVGLLAIPLYPPLPKGDEELVFIKMVQDLFHPLLGGILLAAVLSAIMSTIDSQLLVCSSALAEDFYKRVLKRDASEKAAVRVGRGGVIAVALVALAIAWDEENTVLGLVEFGWGGFGAAFGPLILFALFSRRTSWRSALAGMVMGAAVVTLWEYMPAAGHAWLKGVTGFPTSAMYEIVPGFLANALTIFIFNLAAPQRDAEILDEFRAVAEHQSAEN